MDEKAILGRINDLLAAPYHPNNEAANSAELLAGAATILQAVYGSDSPQSAVLRARIATVEQTSLGGMRGPNTIGAVRGVLLSVKGDIEKGLVGSLTQTVTGEVLSDFVVLARAALEPRTEQAKNVAAVLAAAAFEDTIRRMGVKIGIAERIELQQIVTRLKEAAVLQGPQIGIVQAHLKFRNDALHADWNAIDRIGVSSALNLVQDLLLKHFS